MSEKILYRSKVAANWELEPTVKGTITGFETIKVDKRDTRVMLVEEDQQITQVFEASQLEDLFKVAKPGNRVVITYRGTKDIKGGKRVRLFACTLFGEEGDAASTKPARRSAR